MREQRRTRRFAALALAATVALAACGGDDDSDADDEPATEESTDEPATDDEPADEPADDGGDEPAGEATGEPIKIGFQNAEGDPNGSFPEYSIAARAATEYINAELGGLGGRPIELIVCEMAITPDDSQRCANELVAEGVEAVVSSINFFGNHMAIYQGADIPVIVSTAITVADFTTPGVYSVGAGGGCLGVHTGLVYTATQLMGELEGIEQVNRVGVPWADTPPGVVCYYDLESKPLDVLKGTIPGTSELAGSMPDLEHIGVPVAPALPDATPQATEVLNFEPDVIIFSGQGADCWNLVDAMGRLGWTPDQTPLVLSGACTDFTSMAAAGDLAVGIYLTSTENSTLLDPAVLEEGSQHWEYATTYQTKGLEYGMTEDDIFKGFAALGFSTMMNIWEVSNTIDGEVTGGALDEAFAATDGSMETFGGSPLNCAGAPEPYVAVCSSPITLNQWDGEKLVPVLGGEVISGLDLVAGTELLPGPYDS